MVNPVTEHEATQASSAIRSDELTRGQPETFWYMARRYIFDVDRAIEITSDGRKAVEVDQVSARLSVHESRMQPDRLGRVDCSIPGIIAHVRYRAAGGGELVKGHVLIDGHHRAARCLEEGRPFFAYLLTERESVEVLLRCPPESRPDANELAQME